MLNGKAILVTGGTGSFGQAFVQTVLERFKPARVVVFSRDEQKQYEMRQLFGQPVEYTLGDVRDAGSLHSALAGIDIAVHTAALKQVSSAERNPIEAIKTNILGAQNVVAAARAHRVSRVIEISTDKAVHPINLYGATKLVADKLFLSASGDGREHAKFAVVRYGNFVSRGSVVPYFKKLRLQGAAELPITDTRMTRFWIPLKGAVEFALDCLQWMRGGEIFVPRTPSVRIIDIAKAVAPELRISVIGIRPGEKLHETLCAKDEASQTFRFPRYYVVAPSAAEAAGEPVEDGFEYTSHGNDQFWSVDELRRQEEFTL